MKPANGTQARKRPVNLTLNEDLVEQARSITGNLSGVVEELLADYVRTEHSRRLEKARIADAAAAAWNKFGEEHGSFADEYSTL